MTLNNDHSFVNFRENIATEVYTIERISKWRGTGRGGSKYWNTLCSILIPNPVVLTQL